MPSHPEASPKATCRATTRAGKPCRKQAVDDGLCLFHSGKLDLAELGRRGGKAHGRKKAEHAADQLEGMAHKAIEELLTNAGGSSTARAAAARLVLDKIAASSQYSAALAKKAASAEIAAQMQDGLPAARQRLTRLVERRAKEMAEELYAERMRLEKEAVKAELRVDAPGPERPPGGQPTTAEAIEVELRRAERERIERELRDDP